MNWAASCREQGCGINIDVRPTTTKRAALTDDSVEARSGVSESLLTSAESTEVGGGLGDNVVEQLESDLAGGGTVDGDIEEDLAVDATFSEMKFRIRHVCPAAVRKFYIWRLTTCWIELIRQSSGWW
jgi:hypothetical protein